MCTAGIVAVTATQLYHLFPLNSTHPHSLYSALYHDALHDILCTVLLCICSVVATPGLNLGVYYP